MKIYVAIPHAPVNARSYDNRIAWVRVVDSRLDNTEVGKFVVVNIDDSCPAGQDGHEEDENRNDPSHGIGFSVLRDPTTSLTAFVGP
jgi:hypothetical protein